MRKLGLLSLLPLTLVLLGCAAPVEKPDSKPTEDPTPSSVVGTTKMDDYAQVQEVRVTLSDGRTVTCLALRDYRLSSSSLQCLEPTSR